MAEKQMLFSDLIYGDRAIDVIRKKFPDTIVTDEYVNYTNRFGINIPNVTKDEFFPWFINTGYAGTSFALALRIRCAQNKEDVEVVEEWIRKANVLKSSREG